MPYAIRIHETGGPEQMRWEEVAVGAPGAGEVLVRNTAIGLNYIDVYFRNGLYPAPLPATLGQEGAGIVEALGPRVKDFKVGDRVAYAQPLGAYAELCLRPAARLVKIPQGVTEQQAAAIMLKGMTAWYLLKRTYKVRAGDTILMHAAAGGVGAILCPWAKHLGATVIGTVSSDAKAAIAKKAGCRHVIVTARENFVERVRAITKGAGVPVVYDGVGKDTFMGSIDCLAPLGLMVSFGNASGPVTQFNPLLLSQKGSLYLTRPTLFHYIAERAQLVKAAQDVFSAVKKKVFKVSINQTYPLREAAQAHRDLEARRTTGSTVLLP